MAFAAAAQLALLDQDWPPALLLLPEACEVAMIAGNMWVTQWGGAGRRQLPELLMLWAPSFMGSNSLGVPKPLHPKPLHPKPLNPTPLHPTPLHPTP